MSPGRAGWIVRVIGHLWPERLVRPPPPPVDNPVDVVWTPWGEVGKIAKSRKWPKTYKKSSQMGLKTAERISTLRPWVGRQGVIPWRGVRNGCPLPGWAADEDANLTEGHRSRERSATPRLFDTLKSEDGDGWRHPEPLTSP